MTKFEALCKVLDNFVYEQGAELDKERLEDFMVGFYLGRAKTKCVFLKCPENDGCEKCKYKNFWTKEVGY